VKKIKSFVLLALVLPTLGACNNHVFGTKLEPKQEGKLHKFERKQDSNRARVVVLQQKLSELSDSPRYRRIEKRIKNLVEQDRYILERKILLLLLNTKKEEQSERISDVRLEILEYRLSKIERSLNVELGIRTEFDTQNNEKIESLQEKYFRVMEKYRELLLSYEKSPICERANSQDQVCRSIVSCEELTNDQKRAGYSCPTEDSTDGSLRMAGQLLVRSGDMTITIPQAKRKHFNTSSLLREEVSNPNYQKNLVLNGDFEMELERESGWYVTDSLYGFDINLEYSNSGVEVQYGNTGGIAPSSGNVKIELDAHKNSHFTDSDVSIFQMIETSSVEKYRLSLDYFSRTGTESSDMEVVIDGEVMDYISSQEKQWQTFEYELLGTGDLMKVEFRAIEDNNTSGALIDNIRLESI
jgi:hypothetical protein